jgi:hypothetical protein
MDFEVYTEFFTALRITGIFMLIEATTKGVFDFSSRIIFKPKFQF